MKLWRNNEIKRITIILGLFILMSILLSVVASKIIIGSYQRYFLNYNARVLNIIIDKYPDLDSEIINEILNPKNISNNDLKILEKYGINDEALLSSVKSVKSEYQNILYTTIILTLLIILISIIIFFIFLFKLYKKINELNAYTFKVMSGDGGFDIIDNSEGELSILKNRLYDITRILKENNELLEKDKETLKMAIADISHQLKTPLTSLYLCNEILSDEGDPKQREIFLNKMHQELERIEWLISSLLKMAKLDSRTIVLKKEKINVNDLIDSTLLSLSSIISSKKITIIKEGDSNINLEGDFNWLREALSNVIKNSVEHSKDNDQITIYFNDNPLYIEINIKDNGEGIDAHDLPHIFERFYKAKDSGKESVGIGLALSKTIINNSNGDITAKSKKGEYTLFTIKLYKSEI